MEPNVASAFIEESKSRVATARRMINNALDQLHDDDIWWAPAEGCNCIGIIIQHLLGNLRQYIISGVGGEEDLRDRPREFRIEERTPKSDLQKRLDDMLDRVVETYSHTDPSTLLHEKAIQSRTRTLLGAIYGTMAHLELHAGQICYIARMKLGSAYAQTC